MYGFIDESGVPGVAVNDKDYFLISLVIFDCWEKCEESIEKIEALKKRLGLPVDYEFHSSSNSMKPRREFAKLLQQLDFWFIAVAIKKNDFKGTVSYIKIADILIDEIVRRYTNMKIELDSNPALYKAMLKCFKSRKIYSFKTRQRRSHSTQLLQVADYVANISAKQLKGHDNKKSYYQYIKNKELVFIKK